MRRSLAFQLDQRGVPIKVISAILAHENFAVTDAYIGKRLDVKQQNTLNYLDYAQRFAAAA